MRYGDMEGVWICKICKRVAGKGRGHNSNYKTKERGRMLKSIEE